MEATEQKKLIVLRGLPSSGKSFRAKELAGESGLVYSTDEYWYKVIKPENPDEYNFAPRFLGDAHKWNLLRAQKAIEENKPLILVDNTNTTYREAQPYIDYAVPQGYTVEVAEPTSDWWKEIVVLLEHKRDNKKALKEWAWELAEKSKKTHCVPFWSIERMMWRWELTSAFLDQLYSDWPQ